MKYILILEFILQTAHRIHFVMEELLILHTHTHKPFKSTAREAVGQAELSSTTPLPPLLQN